MLDAKRELPPLVIALPPIPDFSLSLWCRGNRFISDFGRSFWQVLKTPQFRGLFIILLFYLRVCLLVKHPLSFSCSRQSNRPGAKLLNDTEFSLPSAYGFVLMMSLGQLQRCEHRMLLAKKMPLWSACQGLSWRVPCSHHYLRHVMRRGQGSQNRKRRTFCSTWLPLSHFLFFFKFYLSYGLFVCLFNLFCASGGWVNSQDLIWPRTEMTQTRLHGAACHLQRGEGPGVPLRSPWVCL